MHWYIGTHVSICKFSVKNLIIYQFWASVIITYVCYLIANVGWNKVLMSNQNISIRKLLLLLKVEEEIFTYAIVNFCSRIIVLRNNCWNVYDINPQARTSYTHTRTHAHTHTHTYTHTHTRVQKYTKYEYLSKLAYTIILKSMLYIKLD